MYFVNNLKHIVKTCLVVAILHISGMIVCMSQDNLLILRNKATGMAYYSKKNKKKLANNKIKIKKFDKKLRKRVSFAESKK